MGNKAAVKRAVLAQVKKMKLTGKNEILVIKSDEADIETIDKLRAHLLKAFGSELKLVVIVVGSQDDVFKIKVG